VTEVRAARASPVSDRLATLPNALSLLRLLGVPVFLVLVLGFEADVAAVAVLIASGVSDWLDGKIARAWGQTSRIGQLLDPLADRLYIVATIVAFVLRDVLPLELAVVILGRDLLLTACLPVLRRHGYGPLPVHFLGKAATFNLLSAFPLVLLGSGENAVADVVRPFGWGFLWWGVGLYWWAAVLYVVQVVRLVRTAPVAPA